MKTNKLLNEIYYEQKATNRNLQKVMNIALMGILAKITKDAKEKGNESGFKLCKVGLILVVAAEALMIVSEILDFKAKRDEQHLMDLEDEE